MRRLQLPDRVCDLSTRLVTLADDTLTLTSKEAELLAYLAERAGETVSRAELLREVWGYSDQALTRTVDNTVTRLRRKVEVDPNRPRHVVTVFGTGYRFLADSPPAGPTLNAVAHLSGEARIEAGEATEVSGPGDGTWLVHDDLAALLGLVCRLAGDSHQVGVQVGEVQLGPDPRRSGHALTGLAAEHAGCLSRAAAPGQVLLAAEAASILLGQTLEVELRSLDPARIRLAEEPEVVWEASLPGRARVAAGTGGASPLTNLGPAWTGLVDRPELGAIRRLFADRRNRVVTVVGPVGVGKSVLAEQAARVQFDAAGFPGGVWWCDLSEDTSCDAVRRRVADRCSAGGRGALVVLDGIDTALTGGADPSGGSTFGSWLAGEPPVLETEVVALLVGWLQDAPDLRLLLTSRVPLGLPGERVLPIGPLSRAAAAQLFAARLRERRPGYEPDEHDRAVIAELVEQVDRIPLAITLLAGRTRRSIVELRDELRGMGGLKSGPAEAFEGEVAVLEAAGVFGSDFTPAGLAAVADRPPERVAKLVPELCRRGILRAEVRHGTHARFVLVRDPSPTRGPGEEARDRHRQWFVSLAAPEVERMIRGDDPADPDRLRVELAELCQAMEGATDATEVVELALAATVGAVFDGHRPSEAWLGAAAARCSEVAPSLAALALTWHATTARVAGRSAAARADLQLAMLAARQSGSPALESRVATEQARVAAARGELDEAIALVEGAEALPDCGPGVRVLVALARSAVEEAAGALESAFASALVAVDAADEALGTLSRPRTRIRAAGLAAWLGRNDDVIRGLLEARRLAAEADDCGAELDTLPPLCLAWLEHDRVEPALRAAETLRRRAGRGAMASILQGVALLVNGDPESALESLKQVETGSDAVDALASVWSALARRRLGATAAQLEPWLVRAEVLAEDGPLRREVRGCVAVARGRPPPGRRGPWTRLAARIIGG